MKCSRALALAACLALLLVVPSPATAQTHNCPTDGSLLLVFRNPDLVPKPDGFIHAQGQFFVQFQAIGKDADKIKVFGFSFGPHTTDFDETTCGLPQPAPWVTGTYVPNYRADRDPSDGFFIPIKTMLVPDGTYAAAVHAYDESNNELARFWAKAIVDNCDTASTTAQEKCDDDPAQMAAHDKTAPWPIVLPGDGQALNGHTLTIEFGEELANFTVDLNGEDITADLKEWDGRMWDGDYAPDYGPGGLSGAVAQPCTQAYHTCEKYGPAYEWQGRPLTDSDVIRVRATDLAGNVAVKDIHIGSSVAGGAVTGDEPILSYTVDRSSVTTEPGKAATFHFNITNSGGGTGHPFAGALAPTGWTAEWQPMHVVVPPGTTQAQTLVVTPAGNATGTYRVNATLTYRAGSIEKVLAQPLDVVVTGATPTATATATTSQASPLPLPFVAVAAAVLLARRRRTLSS